MVQFSRRVGLLLGVFIAPSLAQADETGLPPLSQAQVALFESPHLASITAPAQLKYAFSREEGDLPVVRDQIVLDVRRVAAAGRHDVYPDFLSGARHINYPPALGFRGNPLLVFALDRDTRELSAATGGSPNWFRQRFRAALVDQATLQRRQVAAAGQPEPIEAMVIELMPFRNEPRARRFQGLRYVFILSEAVPGSIVEIRSMIAAGPDGPSVTESITYAGIQPS